MVNGLDFYPTILSWTSTQKPKGQRLDGTDLSVLLHKHPRNLDLVKDKMPETQEIRWFGTLLTGLPSNPQLG